MPAPSDQTPGESPSFSDLALGDAVLRALQDVGYESPSPIQAATIPHLLAGRDVVGQAQTGTGKTAAFALPILSKIDTRETVPQALVLVPTRELAIQVAEAFQKYATYMKGFHVLPVYGGQSYTPQLQSLRRGVQVVVATPGRAMDHIKRGTLDLSSLKHLVLDEADEMLRMGFIDDVEWILEQIPAERQIALFSATMPTQVRRIAQQHLSEPAEVTIKSKTTTASQIRQRYWIVSGLHKLDALTRILEAEPFDAMIVFARTKIATEDLAARLSARGFAVEALNGDIAQVQRERTIARLKSGQIDIVVATDVAARGLDVERVSHVVNYDVPYDPESYVHRIGRTGRAGRSGEAILFIAPRERNMLRIIERTTRQTVQQMQLPSIEDVNERRVAKFNEKLTAAIAANAGQQFMSLIESYERDNNIPAVEIAAALASIAQGATPLLMEAQGRRGEGSSDAPWSQSSDAPAPRRERAPRSDRAAARSSWAEADDAGARRERAPRSEWSRSERSEKPAWQGRATHSEQAANVESASTEVDQGPKPLNRRERRALERAERERLAAGGEGAAEGVSERVSENESGSGHEPAVERTNVEFDAAGQEAAAPRSAKRARSPGFDEGERPRKRAESRDFGDDDRPRERPRRGGDEDVETYRIEVGHAHGVKPGNIVGAIANEVGLEGRHIGRVLIRDDHSFVDLPAGMPKDVFHQLQKVRVAGQPLQISRALKTHVEKLRRDRPAGPKFRRPSDSKGAKFKARGPRDSHRRR
ncbi:DEAD/DEAH box helicase [Steroidobacter cummioxidans]|uniref:DEAD/DEAH box helicase n=1 Tax=Steroidobacter cummioxidans TaxID=1803913 RepID=UPI001F4E8576|nr:DEAD/DEAH box helicase [Steroidobacter cummioxidans]